MQQRRGSSAVASRGGAYRPARIIGGSPLEAQLGDAPASMACRASRSGPRLGGLAPSALAAPYPLVMTIGTLGSSRRSSRSVSAPSMRGIVRSSRTAPMRLFSLRKISVASTPSVATITSNPKSPRRSRVTSRTPLSSLLADCSGRSVSALSPGRRARLWTNRCGARMEGRTGRAMRTCTDAAPSSPAPRRQSRRGGAAGVHPAAVPGPSTRPPAAHRSASTARTVSSNDREGR